MKILITGGNGFIATNMLDYYLANTKDEIVNVTKFTHASYAHRMLEQIEKKHSDRFTNHMCDINDYVHMKQILDKEKPDQIIHLAAEADVSRSFVYPHDFLKVNLEGTFNLLEWLRHGNTKTRMLHFSTDEVFSEPDHLSKEGERLYPRNPYSASKAATEQYIYAYNSCFDTNVQVVRPVNNYGPYQGTNRLIAKTIVRCMHDEPFYLFAETQKHRRWWIYAEDTVRAVEKIIEKGDHKGIYHITSDTEMSVEDTVKMILKVFKKEHLFKGYSDIRPKDDENYALDGVKLRELGWKPKYTFGEGITKTMEWYNNNLSWFEKR